MRKEQESHSVFILIFFSQVDEPSPKSVDCSIDFVCFKFKPFLSFHFFLFPTLNENHQNVLVLFNRPLFDFPTVPWITRLVWKRLGQKGGDLLDSWKWCASFLWMFSVCFFLSFLVAVFLNVPMGKKPMNPRQKVLKDFFYVNSRTHTKRNETKLTTTNSSGRWPPVVICSLQFFPFDSFPSFHFILGKIIFRCFCWWKHLESNARVDWTRQNLFWENVSRTRLRSSFSLPHHSHRPLPCLPLLLLTWR